MDAALLYILTGVVSGTLAGLLGIGGGLIIVPAITFILNGQSGHIVHIALGTSLAIVVLTAISSTLAHNKKGTIDWYFWRMLSPGLFLGTLGGAIIADYLRGETLRQFFAVFELLVAIQLAFGIQAKPGIHKPGRFILFLLTLPIGIVSALAGIGGGTMVVPLLSWLRLNIKQAVSTSAACGLPIAVAGSVGFGLIGLDSNNELPGPTTGFIYWPAFFYISVFGVLFAPLGVKLAHALPAQVLRRVFALFLLSLAAFMYFG